MGAWVSFWLPFQDGHIRLLSFFGKVGVCFGAEVNASEVHFGKKWSRFVFGWEMAFLFKKHISSFEIAKCPSLRVLWSSDRWHTTSTRGRLAAGPGLFQPLWWWGQGWPGNPVHGRDAVDNHSTSSKRSWLVSSPKQKKAFNMMLDR